MRFTVTQIMIALALTAGAMPLTEIPDSAYAGTDIREIVIPSTVSRIGDYAFAGCDSLVSVRFEPGAHLKSIGAHAFAFCPKIEIIDLPAEVAEVGEGAFRDCERLRYLALPPGLTLIPHSMCNGCSELTDVEIPAGVTTIKGSAFARCTQLRAINLPDGLTSLGSNAFAGCASLRSVYVPDSVTELESYAFASCTALTEARLPANPSLLGELIFSCCPNLSVLIEPSPSPPPFDCMSYIFEPDDREAYSRCRLMVPKDTEAAYRQAPGWNLFIR